MRAALVDETTGVITNVIEISDDAPESYSPPEGFRVELDEDGKAEVGGTFTDGVWGSAPVSDAPVIQPEASTQEQLDALTALLKEKAVLTDVDISDIKEPKVPEDVPVEPVDPKDPK